MLAAEPGISKTPFLIGVFLLTMTVLLFQIVQTRILSVVAWYYLAFFAISVAMLGMTAGAVWVYLQRNRFNPQTLATRLTNFSLATAIAMPASLLVQFCLITRLEPVFTSVASWALLMGAMTVPYIFAGVVVSLALTRSPFPASQVYGVDLLGAALGCVAVIGISNVLEGPSIIILAGAIAAGAAFFFAAAASPAERAALASQPRWRRPLPVLGVLLALTALNASIPIGLRPVLVKDAYEGNWLSRFERWNSYSRIVAFRGEQTKPFLWGPSPLLPEDLTVQQAWLNIDGLAGTAMNHFDGTRESIDFLRYDIVNLAYYLPGIHKSAVIGVGGGRDLMSAHLFGVEDITGVELNRIFIDLHTSDPYYKVFSNLTAVPGIHLEVDDARSWFASTDQRFDLIQMSMIDTFAATGAGAFSLSENGLYTIEGWRAFMGRLNPQGIFTVSRWYNPGDVNESGRMVVLALAALMAEGVAEPRQHVFVASADTIATLVLSREPFSAKQVEILTRETRRLGFEVLVTPDRVPKSPVMRAIVSAPDIASLNRAGDETYLDLTVPTDNRPFFFNQLPFSRIPEVFVRMRRGELRMGVVTGNLQASMTLVLILAIAVVSVVCAIVLPLSRTARSTDRSLIFLGTAYFALIGMGFMFAEISMLQYFSIYLGHPIYAMGICLFSLILSTGLGSLASGRLPLATVPRVLLWGVLVGVYLLVMQATLDDLFRATTAQALWVRIATTFAVVMPVGFLMGFGFPTGIRLVEAVSREPTAWFWGINGATGVLASVLAVMLSMAFGINVTMTAAGVCYLVLIPTARSLMAVGLRTGSAVSPQL